MSKFSDAFDNTIELPVADTVIASNENGTTTTAYQYAVRRPEEYENDFMVEVRASSLRKIRKLIEPAKKPQFPFHEILLGLSFLCLGAIISGILTGILLDTFEGKILYIFCSIVATATFISYVFLRNNDQKNLNALAISIEENLIDPDKTK